MTVSQVRSDSHRRRNTSLISAAGTLTCTRRTAHMQVITGGLSSISEPAAQGRCLCGGVALAQRNRVVL